MDDDPRDTADGGFVEHLTKPVDVDTLLAAIGRVTDHSR